MVDENRFDEQVSENDQLERALASMALRPSTLDRDRLLFLAGQASVERARPGTAWSRWAWPAATVTSTVTALVLAAMLFTQSGSTGATDPSSGMQNTAQTEKLPANSAVVEKVRSSTAANSANFVTNTKEVWLWSQLQSASATNAETVGERSNYLQLRTVVLAHGINALPVPRTVKGQTSLEQRSDGAQSRRELLDELLNSDSRLQDNRL